MRVAWAVDAHAAAVRPALRDDPSLVRTMDSVRGHAIVDRARKRSAHLPLAVRCKIYARNLRCRSWRLSSHSTHRVSVLARTDTAAEPVVVAVAASAVAAIAVTVRPIIASSTPAELSGHQTMAVLLHSAAFETWSPIAHCNYRCVEVTEDLRCVDRGQPSGIADLSARATNIVARLTSFAFIPPDSCRLGNSSYKEEKSSRHQLRISARMLTPENRNALSHTYFSLSRTVSTVLPLSENT